MVSVRDIIIDQNKSCYELSKEIGIASCTLKSIVDGEKKRFKKETAKAICKYFNLDIKTVKEFEVLYDHSISAAKAAKARKENEAKKIKILKEVVGERCRNKVCPFSKDGHCTNEIVVSGKAGCSNKDVPKEETANFRKRKDGKIGIVINHSNTLNYKKRGKTNG